MAMLEEQQEKDLNYFKYRTVLFRLVEESKWNKVVARCYNNPTEAGKWVVRKGKDGTITWRRLPLHEACIRRAPGEAIAAIIDAFPIAVRATDSFGRLPLHHACVHGASEDTIENLLMVYPESIDVSDVWGKTPILNVKGSSSENKDIIIEMLEKRPLYYAVKVAEWNWAEAEERKRTAYIDAFNSKFEEAQKKHNLIVYDLEKQLDTERSKSSSLSEKLQCSMTKEKMLENRATIDEVEIESLREKKTDLIEKNISLTETVSSLREEVQSLAKKNAALTATVISESVEIDSLRKKMTDLTHKNSSLETRLQKFKEKYNSVAYTIAIMISNQEQIQQSASKYEECLKQATINHTQLLQATKNQEDNIVSAATKQTEMSETIRGNSKKINEGYSSLQALVSSLGELCTTETPKIGSKDDLKTQDKSDV